jgi:ABC-type Fe3+-siderophore transport system permease subunit
MTIFLAITIVVSGIMIAISNYKGEREALTLFGNFSGMFVFGVLYLFAVKNRHKSDIHKRLMIVASIAMLSPALVRILRIFDINDFVTLPFWLLYIAVLPIYDYRKLKKVQKATLFATGFLLIILFGGAPIGMSEGWANLMESIFRN